MRHEAGLHKFHKKIESEWLSTENILKNKVGEIIETDTLGYVTDQESERWYHSFTRDWITNEIFRRVEGKTMGQFLDSKDFGVYCGHQAPNMFKQRLMSTR
jgi:hypothetical protein